MNIVDKQVHKRYTKACNFYRIKAHINNADRTFRFKPIFPILKQIFNNQKQRMLSELTFNQSQYAFGIVLIKYRYILFQTFSKKNNNYLTFKRNIIDFHILHSVSFLTGSMPICVSLGILDKRW